MTTPIPRPITIGVLLDFATDPLPDTGCRLWSRCVDDDGYGTIRLNGRTVRVPRLVLALSFGLTVDELLAGELPPHIVTRHTCHRPRCTEPDHLLPGTVAMNAADSMERRRQIATTTETP